MKHFQLCFADKHGLQMLSHRILVRAEEHKEPTITKTQLQRALPILAPAAAEQGQIQDDNGYPLTPWMSLTDA